jgi:molecular chaperone GrpE
MASKHSNDQSLHVSTKQFEDLLKDEGVIKIKAHGNQFDPSIMECVQIKKGKENIVIEETRSGFMLHDKLLRPAQVIVGSEEEKGE